MIYFPYGQWLMVPSENSHVNFMNYFGMSQISIYDDFEDFVEFIGRGAFDILGACFEVTRMWARTARWTLTVAVSPSKISRYTPCVGVV